MDTRTKILTPEAAVKLARGLRSGGTTVKVVTGYFDPLLAGHARRLGEIANSGGALMVAIEEPPRAILPARARAELVAALSVVDYVILREEPVPADWLEDLQPNAVLREEAADERRTEDLIRHVQSRHN